MLDATDFDVRGEAEGTLASPSSSASAAVVRTNAPEPAVEALLWGQWGGVGVIAVLLVTVVIGLTLTVGAVPF
ncbi:UNVERIFIED_CONTAM: hypothetical protein DES50_11149 [Williamsia faeni]